MIPQNFLHNTIFINSMICNPASVEDRETMALVCRQGLQRPLVTMAYSISNHDVDSVKVRNRMYTSIEE
jgi:hypothetical protein